LLARPDVPTLPLYVSPRPAEGVVAAVEAVDVSHLGLDGVRVSESSITLGAAATLEGILRSEVGRAPGGDLLCAACRTTAHAGLRAVASVGGVVLFDPTCDLYLALLALDAEGVLRGATTRDVPLAEFAPEAGELLVEVRIPRPQGALGAALERAARTPRDRSIVAAAAAIEVDGAACARARLALSGLAPQAVRWPAAERALEGRPVTAERIAEAAAAVEARARPEGDHLGSAEYRRAVGAVLARRALAAAWQRAGGPARP
jgi:xanthine dehydrogenase small subunit